MKSGKKNPLSFLRSMRFGMILLGLIALLCVAGSVIPQGESETLYQAQYGGMAGVITTLGIDHLFSTWYFVGLFLLLCVNLLTCSALRVRGIGAQKKALIAKAEKAQTNVHIEGSAEAWLKKKGFKRCEAGYIRRALGLYGSFVTHAGLLLLIVASACAFQLEKKTDYSIPVGESVTLENGVQLRVDAFSVADENGNVDYVSDLTAIGPDGSEQHGVTRVNAPVKLFGCKVYQQSYNAQGVVDIRVGENGADERTTLDQGAFISLDGTNGVSYMGSFGEYVITDDGHVYPAGYNDVQGRTVSAYMVGVLSEDKQELQLAVVDETFDVGGVYYTFRAPSYYPGLRVKTAPAWVLPLLYASFGVLLVGLYLCFFHVPMAASARETGAAIVGAKDISDYIENANDENAQDKQ